jgi:hypothetical protein
MKRLGEPAFCSPFLDGCGARRTDPAGGETRAGRLRTDSVSGLHARIVREGRTNVPVSQAGRGDAATRADLERASGRGTERLRRLERDARQRGMLRIARLAHESIGRDVLAAAR